jgi:hypothetical protein
MSATETLTQGLVYTDTLNYQTVNNASVTTLGTDLSKYGRVIYLVRLHNTVAGTGTLDGRLQGSATSAFTVNTNITGTNFTQLTANNTATTVEIRADQLAGFVAGYRYVRLSLTGATNAVTVDVIGLASDAKAAPGSQGNLNTSYLTAGVVCNL